MPKESASRPGYAADSRLAVPDIAAVPAGEASDRTVFLGFKELARGGHRRLRQELLEAHLRDHDVALPRC